ncbi:MFS transporter [Nostoc sp. UHCC 0870]|uniref:MFS transporter n=1 Tax=Nostoc sp. UHCC 0870 TaxID=2914041 RepID=UPI001EDE09BC|nr:MFS transporter [Nostoc sp. UHCC 0870]UKO97477.1 MFS transporter [Nostoc sp. UHCC 0870]
MLQISESILMQPWLSFSVAPTTRLPDVIIPVEPSFVFSGSQFLVALLAGTLMAIAFQLLLTNFSVAAGISTLGNDVDDGESESFGRKIRKVEAKVGAWGIITASIALFAACFLAVKLSLIDSALLGAIIGVVIWSTYFLLVAWLGSSAVGSLLGSIINTVNSGLQSLMGTATTAIGAGAAQKQAVSTAEEITAAVRRELTAGLDVESITNTLQNSLSSLPLPKLDLGEVRSQFDKILSDIDWGTIGDGDLLKNINRQTFVDLVSSRTNLSKENINQIADQLNSAWEQTFTRRNPTEQVINLLQSATPEELKSADLGERLQQLVTAGRKNGNSRNGVIKQAVQYGVSAAIPAVLDRVDIADIDVDKITNQLQKLKDKVQDIDVDKITHEIQQLRDKTTEQITERFPAPSDNTIKSDIKEYILNSFPWHFNRITIRDEFPEVIYDPQADPTNVRQQLEQLQPDDFSNWLTRRGDISEARVTEISQQMDSIRHEVLETVRQSERVEKGHKIRLHIENYLRATDKEQLNPEAIQQDFANLLAELNGEFTDFSTLLQGFDREAFVQLLLQRQDFNAEEANNIVSQLEGICNDFSNQAREKQEQATARVNQVWQRVEDYLRHTKKDELNPEGIRRDFRALLTDPEVGIQLLRSRLSQFDRDTFVKLLSQRQDLNEEQINQIIHQLESVRDNVLQAPQAVREQYDRTITAIGDYLRNTKLEELNPEGIRRDLETLLTQPKEGAEALRDRLAQVDRETLVKLLTQQGNLSEEQVNQTIDQVQEAIGNIIKTPRRLLNRTTQRVGDFTASLENYLRHTNKEELNPEGIKRDLRLLLQDPRLGVENLGDRVSKFDRSTMVALLSEREDISEEEANRIVEQIESTRNSIVQQFQQIQQKFQSAIDQIFGKIRNYLDSLERPELSYEGIRQDFAKVFDDPQVGFAALRDRLSQFDRDTLVAILSSREDISQEDANRIINQIEAARDSVLQRAERIQQETQKRIKAVQEQAKKQAEETRKTVASAAWWLFGTALSSLVASVIAGVIAVTGLSLPG